MTAGKTATNNNLRTTTTHKHMPNETFNLLAQRIRQIINVATGAAVTITELNDKLQAQTQRVAELTAQNTAKDTEIADLKNRLDEAWNSLATDSVVDISDLQSLSDQLGAALGESALLHSQAANVLTAIAETHAAITDATPTLAEAIEANTVQVILVEGEPEPQPQDTPSAEDPSAATAETAQPADPQAPASFAEAVAAPSDSAGEEEQPASSQMDG